MIEAIPIISPFVPIAVTLVELIGHSEILKTAAGEVFKTGVGKTIDTIFDRIGHHHSRLISRDSLIALQAHFAALKDTTDELATETCRDVQSERYEQLRSNWLNLFGPTLAVLHNLDPNALVELDIYSARFGILLGKELKVTRSTLSEALAKEREEINYDSEGHLCTLCLQIVRCWSEAGTMVGGLRELSTELELTMATLGKFIACNWPLQSSTS